MTTIIRTWCDVTATVGETGCVGNRAGQAPLGRGQVPSFVGAKTVTLFITS